MTIRVKLNQVAVQRAIARRNMSQNVLAIRAGISSGYISQIMSGTRNPSPAVRQKLQDALKPLTFDDIFIIEESGNGSKDGHAQGKPAEESPREQYAGGRVPCDQAEAAQPV